MKLGISMWSFENLCQEGKREDGSLYQNLNTTFA